MPPLRVGFFFGMAVFCAGVMASAETITVGPGQQKRDPSHVAWGQLEPGDIVEIHWRPEPYRNKWALSRQGTPDKPIIVRGIRNEKGEMPEIDASRAVAPNGQLFWGEARSVVKIGESNDSGDEAPAHLIVENLHIHGAKPETFFLGKDGLTEYVAAASAIYIESGHHITIRNCRLHDCGNGLFVAPASEEILVEGCDVFDNGNVDSVYEHNVYSEAKGITYQFNRFGPLRFGCRGNNLKDRSAGLIVRYNRIEKGNRQLDIVDSQEGMEIRNDPRYHLAQVYGNLLIEHEGADNNQIVHFGGDSGDDQANRHSLLFYNNTVISTRTEKTVLVRLSTNSQSADIFNNVIYTPAEGKTFAIVDAEGQVNLRGNYMKPGWKKCHGKYSGTITASGMIEVDDPGFVDSAKGDYQPGPGSVLRDKGEKTPEEGRVRFEPPWLDRAAIKRKEAGRLDLGCFEGK